MLDFIYPISVIAILLCFVYLITLLMVARSKRVVPGDGIGVAKRDIEDGETIEIEVDQHGRLTSDAILFYDYPPPPKKVYVRLDAPPLACECSVCGKGKDIPQNFIFGDSAHGFCDDCNCPTIFNVIKGEEATGAHDG